MEEVPFEDRHVPKAEIEWERSLWWWIPITRAIHPSIKATTLVLALVSIWIAKAGVTLAGYLFQPADIDGNLIQLPAFAWTTQTTSGFYSPIVNWVTESAIVVASMQIGPNQLAFLTFLAVWLTLAFSILGGVLARRALVELGQQTIAPWGESFQIVGRRWLSFLWATGMHLIGLLALLVPFIVLGLISRLGSAGANIAGVLLLLCFPLAFWLGRLLMSMILCYPLSVCAIAAEKKADAFEGFSRSNAYFFQRPVVAALCVAVLCFVGLVGEQIVMWTLYLGWGLIRTVYFYFGALQDTPGIYISAGNALCESLVSAYWLSYFWSSSAAVYLILRRSVDSAELDDLDSIESPVEETMPEIPKSPPESAPAEKPSAEESAKPEESSDSAEA
ncbi:MAG: hypothetical protein AAF483_08420 [Planctomycetota bacterium]